MDDLDLVVELMRWILWTREKFENSNYNYEC